MTGGSYYLSDLLQGRLEVSCVLKFQLKNKQDKEKAEQLITNSLRKSINDILPISVVVSSDQHVSLPNRSEAPVSTSDDACL